MPIICVGETADDLESTARAPSRSRSCAVALEGVRKGNEIVVAYEPVWAIGSGRRRPREQAQQVCAALRECSPRCWARTSPQRTRILYGGSVKAANIAGFMREPDIDGALVGGASLELEEFASIVAVPEARRNLTRRLY